MELLLSNIYVLINKCSFLYIFGCIVEHRVDLRSLVEQNKPNVIPPMARMTNYVVLKFGKLCVSNVSYLVQFFRSIFYFLVYNAFWFFFEMVVWVIQMTVNTWMYLLFYWCCKRACDEKKAYLIYFGAKGLNQKLLSHSWCTCCSWWFYQKNLLTTTTYTPLRSQH